MVIAESIKVVDFWLPLFDSNFSHSKRDFWPKPTIPEKFNIFWESDEQKIFAINFDSFHARKKHFHLVGDFFRAQLYLTKVCLRDLKYGSVEAEWSIDIIKWP